MPGTEISEAYELFLMDFRVDRDSMPVPADLEEWRKRICDVINDLLDRDMERLLHILYRLDVNEQKVKAILSAAEPGEIAPELANLVLKRELQKVETRRKYRQ